MNNNCQDAGVLWSNVKSVLFYNVREIGIVSAADAIAVAIGVVMGYEGVQVKT